MVCRRILADSIKRGNMLALEKPTTMGMRKPARVVDEQGGNGHPVIIQFVLSALISA